MAMQYGAVCLFDFLLAPMLSFMFAYLTHGTYIPWEPVTLKESGFYHMSMGGICGVSAWTRGQEKIARIGMSAGYDGDSPEPGR